MLTILRHGRTDANRAGLLLGRLDVELDPLGEAQAAAAAAAIGTPDLVISSPLARTRATAAAFGVDVEIDERWVELDYGDYDGTPLADVPGPTWAKWRSDLDFAPPGGESLRELGRRVRAACQDVATMAIDKHVVVVTHVSPIKAAVAWALGVDDEVSWRMFVQPASVSQVAVTERGTSLHAFNVTSHLDALA